MDDDFDYDPWANEPNFGTADPAAQPLFVDQQQHEHTQSQSSGRPACANSTPCERPQCPAQPKGSQQDQVPLDSVSSEPP
eukprot:3318217-Pyramimonas_sp.AAC.1